MNPFDFVQPLNAPYARSQRSGQHYPKTETAYVLKLLGNRPHFGDASVGKYVSRYDAVDSSFSYDSDVQAAVRFSAAEAAQVLEKRRAMPGNYGGSFAILPVKVTTTPAVAMISPKTETVPGKTGYEIVVLGQPGYLPVEVLSSVNGGTWQYVRSLYGHQPKRFASFSEALAVIEAARNTTKGEKAAVRPVITPATTKTTLVEETVPAKTTVELL